MLGREMRRSNRSQLSDGMERAWSISRPKNWLIIKCNGWEIAAGWAKRDADLKMYMICA